MTSEQGNNVEKAMQRAVDVARVIGGRGYPIDEDRRRQRAKEYFERDFYPEGR